MGCCEGATTKNRAFLEACMFEMMEKIKELKGKGKAKAKAKAKSKEN